MNRHRYFRELLARREELSPFELAQIDAHLRDCIDCRQAAAAYERQDELIRALQPQARSDALQEAVLDRVHRPSVRPARAHAWLGAPLAAMLVLAVIALTHAPASSTPSAPLRHGPGPQRPPFGALAPVSVVPANASASPCATAQAPSAMASRAQSIPYAPHQSTSRLSCLDRAPAQLRILPTPGLPPFGVAMDRAHAVHQLRSDPASPVFIFGRTAGFVDPYQVIIYRNGAVRLTAHLPETAHLRTRAVRISGQQLLGLLRFAETEGFFALPPRLQGKRLIHASLYSINIDTTTGRKTVVEAGPHKDTFFALYDTLRNVSGVCVPGGSGHLCNGR